MHLQYDIYHTVNPGIFRRGARINTAPGLTSPSTTPPLTRFPTNERLILVLTSELGGGAVGIVHGGILTVESSREKSSSLKVAAKLSFTPRQQKALLHEISVYKHMTAKGVEGVPIILGDWHDSEEDGPSCVLMTYAGLSLRDRRAKITPDQRYDRYARVFQKKANVEARNGFIAILKSIHAAGISHDDLRAANLMIDESGRPVIIDFERSRFNTDRMARRKEFLLLLRILDAKTMKHAPPADPSPGAETAERTADVHRPVRGKRSSGDRDDEHDARVNDSDAKTAEHTPKTKIDGPVADAVREVPPHGPGATAADGDGVSLCERRAGGMTLRPLKRK